MITIFIIVLTLYNIYSLFNLDKLTMLDLITLFWSNLALIIYLCK